MNNDVKLASQLMPVAHYNGGNASIIRSDFSDGSYIRMRVLKTNNGYVLEGRPAEYFSDPKQEMLKHWYVDTKDSTVGVIEGGHGTFTLYKSLVELRSALGKLDKAKTPFEHALLQVRTTWPKADIINATFRTWSGAVRVVSGVVKG